MSHNNEQKRIKITVTTCCAESEGHMHYIYVLTHKNYSNNNVL